MRVITLLLLLTTLMPCLEGCHRAADSNAVTDDQIKLYRSAYEYVYKRAGHPLNIADTTESFHPSGLGPASCLKEFSATPSDVVRRLPPSTFDGLPAKLLKPGFYKRNDKAIEEGILVFSDIVYNAAGNHAAFNYSYRCGGLCGGGETLVFERTNGKWVLDEKVCDSWIV
jgi:hypothetical protein